jgi:hypothetical protein
VVALPGGGLIEGSWIPPIRTFDVKANVASGALSWRMARLAGGRVELIPRVSFLVGRVEGAITCNEETADEGSVDLRVYYATVCHDTDSDDHFEPRHIAGEGIVAFPQLPFRPYLALGARRERTRFDIGVLRSDGTRDLDHPVLELRTTRMHGSAGGTWVIAPWLHTAGELYYAPGSVATVRLLVGVTR